MNKKEFEILDVLIEIELSKAERKITKFTIKNKKNDNISNDFFMRLYNDTNFKKQYDLQEAALKSIEKDGELSFSNEKESMECFLYFYERLPGYILEHKSNSDALGKLVDIHNFLGCFIKDNINIPKQRSEKSNLVSRFEKSNDQKDEVSGSIHTVKKEKLSLIAREKKKGKLNQSDDNLFNSIDKSYYIKQSPGELNQIEALSSELYRLLLGKDRSAKARPVFDGRLGILVGTASKEISGFQSLADYYEKLKPNSEEENKNFIKGLINAGLGNVLAAYELLAENDDHFGNTGLNGEGKLTHIDSDQTLYPMTAMYHGNRDKNIQENFEVNQDRIESLVGVKSPAGNCFSNEIRTKMGEDFSNCVFDSIKKNEKFIEDKWRTCLKYLLIDDSVYLKLCTQFISDETKRKNIFQYLIDRRKKYEDTLMGIEGFSKYINSVHRPNLLYEFTGINYLDTAKIATKLDRLQNKAKLIGNHLLINFNQLSKDLNDHLNLINEENKQYHKRFFNFIGNLVNSSVYDNKVNAIKKTLEYLDGGETPQFTDAEWKALNNGRLGKIITEKAGSINCLRERGEKTEHDDP